MAQKKKRLFRLTYS